MRKIEESRIINELMNVNHKDFEVKSFCKSLIFVS